VVTFQVLAICHKIYKRPLQETFTEGWKVIVAGIVKLRTHCE